MTEIKQEEKELTKRELIALWVLFLVLKVVKPTAWTHEYSEELKKIRELLTNNPITK